GHQFVELGICQADGICNPTLIINGCGQIASANQRLASLLGVNGLEHLREARSLLVRPTPIPAVDLGRIDASRRISTARSLDMRADGCIFVQCMLLPSPY